MRASASQAREEWPGERRPDEGKLSVMQSRHAGVRLAGSGDARAVADLWLRSRRSAVPSIPPPVHDDDEVRAWFQDVVLPKGDTWVVELEDQLVGILVLDDVWIDQLYIDPSWTSRGLGSRLLDFAKEVRPDGLDLWTFSANTGARRFYERHGFIPVGETDGHNEEGAPDVRYHWDGR